MWFEEPERFAVDELAALVHRATGGDLHVVLAPEPVWRSDEAGAKSHAAVAELYDKYAPEPAEREEPGLIPVAELLSRPPEARYGWISSGGVRLDVLVAGSSWFGLIAVREGLDVWLRMFEPDRLSAILAKILPDDYIRPAAQSVRVLRSELLAAGNPSKVPRVEVRQVLRFAELKPYVNAEFHAETRDSEGKRQRSAFPLRVYDTDTGRWALRTQAHYQDEQMDLIPASTADVADLLDDLRREL